MAFLYSAQYPVEPKRLKGVKTKMKAVTILATTLVLVVLTVFLSICPTSVSALVITDDASGGGCSSVGNWNASMKTCTLTQDLSEPVIVSGTCPSCSPTNNIILDGAGHSISTTALSGTGIDTRGVNATIRNATVSGFGFNIFVHSRDNVIESVRSENSSGGVGVLSSKVTFIRNTFAHNGGAVTFAGSDLTFTQNNFLDNGNDIGIDVFDVWDSRISLFRPLPEGGNYWSRYDTPGEGCSDTTTDGFCDAPYSPNTVTRNPLISS
jgi:hypothetical protein